MNIHFQPKIIIGSVVGFIATAIGVIAVFFPSLFNLEKKEIAYYKETLVNVDDFKKLVDFLYNHQEEIVNLNLTYFENSRVEYKSDWSNHTYSFSKVPLNESTEGGDGNGIDLVGEIDNNGYVISSSKYHMGLFMQTFTRDRGGFGIWIKDIGEDRGKDKNYIIDIPKNSDGNILYKWSMRDYDHKEEMNLEGTFFVEKFVSNLDYNKKSGSRMSDQWENESCEGDACYPITIIELDPISKRDLKIKNY